MATHFPKSFDTEGPLGLPMKDAQAQMLEGVLKQLASEDRVLQRQVIAKAPSELLDGERADVSWISTEALDRENEVVVARGMNDAHFRLNPIVTLNHDYAQPPVGRSLWRRRVRDGELAGVKAKTQYPARPEGWPGADWPPDSVFALIKAGLLVGKSVGFLRLKSHAPTADEVRSNPALASCSRIIDEWLLLEYACTFLPMNPAAVVEAVSKSALPPAAVRRLGLEAPPIAFTPLAEFEKALTRQLAAVDQQELVRQGLERALGRV